MEKGGLSRSLRRAGVRPGTLIGFADEMRVGLRGMVRRVWGVRGLKVVQRLQLRYEWKYLFLVVDFVRGKLEWAWMDSMKSETVVRAVLGMEAIHAGKSAGVGWSAESQKRVGQECCGGEDDSSAPYSPELNPAERVVEEGTQGVEGRVYESLEEKMAAVDECLSRLESDPERMKSLVSWSGSGGTCRDCLRLRGIIKLKWYYLSPAISTGCSPIPWSQEGKIHYSDRLLRLRMLR